MAGGARLGKRAAGQDHDQVLTFLKEAGKDGADLEKDLRRLLPMKTKAEYDPDDIPLSAASKAVDRPEVSWRRPTRCVLRYAVADSHSTRTHECRAVCAV